MKRSTIIFTKHLLERMRTRQITKEQILHTINAPDYTKRSDIKLRKEKEYFKKFVLNDPDTKKQIGKYLKVIGRPQKNKIIGITAMWDYK